MIVTLTLDAFQVFFYLRILLLHSYTTQCSRKHDQLRYNIGQDNRTTLPTLITRDTHFVIVHCNGIPIESRK